MVVHNCGLGSNPSSGYNAFVECENKDYWNVSQHDRTLNKCWSLLMAKIEFGFSQKNAYDFIIKTETRKTTKENGMIVTEKLHKPIYKNHEIDMWGYTDRITTENAPAILKNVEFFIAPNPFGKFGLGEHYEPYGWTMPMTLLAFKKGYIDGFLTHRGDFFQPTFVSKTESIIVVDPIRRIEVRKYFENEFKEFLEHCKEEDFEYSLMNDFSYKTRIGISKSDTLQDIYNWLGKQSFTNPKEKEAINKFGKEKVIEACANLSYYTTDMYNLWGDRLANPLVFTSKKEAEIFKDKYNKWQDIYREVDTKRNIEIVLVNDTFECWIRNKCKRN